MKEKDFKISFERNRKTLFVEIPEFSQVKRVIVKTPGGKVVLDVKAMEISANGLNLKLSNVRAKGDLIVGSSVVKKVKKIRR